MYVPSQVSPDRVEQRILEVVPRIPAGGAISGWAALRVWGGGFFDGLASDGHTRLPIAILVPRSGGLAKTPDIRQIRSKFTASDVTVRHGIPVARPERAVFDEVRQVLDPREAVVVVDMALVARLTTAAALREVTNTYGRLRGVPELERALAYAIDRSRSPQETRMRLIWTLDAMLPTPLCNWPIADLSGRYLGKPDLLSPELGVFGEFDGAGHRSRRQHRIDVEREQSFRDAGLEGFNLVGADVHHPELAVRRMRAAINRAAEAGRPRAWLQATNPPPLVLGA